MRRIQVHVGLVSVAASGEPVGQFWIEYQGGAFPEVGWEDYPCAMVLELVRAIDGGTDSSQKVAFFEGDFEVIIASGGAGTVTVQLFENEQNVAQIVGVDTDSLRLELVRAMATLLEQSSISEYPLKKYREWLAVELGSSSSSP